MTIQSFLQKKKAVCLLLLFSCYSAGIFAQNINVPLFEETDVFIGGHDDINTYRIPSLVCTKKGTLLAFAEGRRDNNLDGSTTHLVLKRSLSNTNSMVTPRRLDKVTESRFREKNLTWLPMQTLLFAKDGESFMNPIPIINKSDNSIILLVNHYPHYSEKEGGGKGAVEIWVLKSKNEGATWSKPINLTSSVGNIALGPGIGIQMKQGRLIAPVYDGVIFSDDNGRTWKAGNKKQGPVDECQAVELTDGTVMVNTRGYPFRTITLSKDNGNNWEAPYKDSSLTDSKLWGGCQASLIRYSRKDEGYAKDRLLYSYPNDSLYRFDVTVRMSYDEGKTWPVSKLIKKGPGAYSCLTIFPDGSIGIIYETGNCGTGIVEYYAKLSFARFNIEWLTDRQDHLNNTK